MRLVGFYYKNDNSYCAVRGIFFSFMMPAGKYYY